MEYRSGRAESSVRWGLIIPGLSSNADSIILYILQRFARLIEYVKKRIVSYCIHQDTALLW